MFFFHNFFPILTSQVRKCSSYSILIWINNGSIARIWLEQLGKKLHVEWNVHYNKISTCSTCQENLKEKPSCVIYIVREKKNRASLHRNFCSLQMFKGTVVKSRHKNIESTEMKSNFITKEELKEFILKIQNLVLVYFLDVI